MLQEIDKRNYIYSNDSDAFLNPGLRRRDTSRSSLVNPLTGSPTSFVPEDNNAHSDQSFITRALKWVNDNSDSFANPNTEGIDFIPDPKVIKTSSNTSVVHLHQMYRGIPVFEMSRTFRFSQSDKLENIVGDHLNIDEEININPVIDVCSAMSEVINYINSHPQEHQEEVDAWGQPLPPIDLNTTGYVPKILAAFSSTAQYTVLEQGEFGEPILANLVIFPQNPKSRLSWSFIITLKNLTQFEIIVAADQEQPGEILLCRESSFHIKAKGNVYEYNGEEEPILISFPRPITDYPVKPITNLPQGFPNDWVDETETIGNSTDAVVCNSDLSTTECMQASHINGELQNGIVMFVPEESTGNEQNTLNAFYFCNYMHDFFYMLGFDEESGNFQKKNSSRLGLSGDNVKVNVFNKAVYGTANMYTPVDGQSPVMNLGLVESSNRHTALDADVVFHEYTHGVTNRLVGGVMDQNALRAPQSRGMGEGYSDYFALTIQNFDRDTEKVVSGSWVTNDPDGIRKSKYDDSFPYHFGHLGTGRFVGPHDIGEVWCAILMYLNRRIVEKFGRDKGYNLTWRIVIDSLKLSPSNPSFIDARNAMFDALKDLKSSGHLSEADFNTVNKYVWQTFCKFGLGPNAISNRALLSGIVTDFELPENI